MQVVGESSVNKGSLKNKQPRGSSIEKVGFLRKNPTLIKPWDASSNNVTRL